ncbi:PAS and ANTAR domain-containing protein [Pseudarthrobacter enclensis]|uniref:PAS and ANTAR domain-containing protein n=1 Tax=Pseudarthrobacter enclensis TaxID=993070 RepID=UPI00341A06EF
MSSSPASAKLPADGYLDCPTGQVLYYFSDQVFRWSEGLFRIYGYTPGEVVPSMEMALAHIEPDDRAPVLAFWEKVSVQGGPSSIYVSIRDSKDRQHKLLFSADFIFHEESPVGVRGVVVDLTQAIHTDRHELATQAVAASALNRDVIEQAKGILMARSGIDADRAYEIMSQLSQDTNRKVYAIAHQIINDTVVADQRTTRTTD